MQKKLEVMEQNQSDEQKRFEQWYNYMRFGHNDLQK
jgi:hypothetical protein